MREQLTCGFIGLGLIGGSIAKALRNSHPDYYLIAYDIKKDALSAALADKVIDEAAEEIGASFSACDYIFLCAPVSHNDQNIQKLSPYLSDSCLITDVGSVKTDIHETINALGLNAKFIGGHPMAGSERTGYINSKAILLENAYYILTPTREVSPEKVEQYRNLVISIGAIPLILSHKEHDHVTAAVSHLPHVIAASLVNLIQAEDSKEGLMKMIAAGGFKDITRIASSSPAMWQQICLTNTENIVSMLNDFIQTLERMKNTLSGRQSKEIYRFFENARNYRDSFMDASRGPIKSYYGVTIEIADEPGALASIATILALNQISIKNIGILHNREQQDGALGIEFYEEDSILSAKKILEQKGYIVHER